MSTHLPPLTTEQLIAACRQEAVTVSRTQLGRWVRAGLIPTELRKRHGRGQGKGTEWLWDRTCVPRAALIARTLATGDPSLQRAALALALAGFAPSASCLRSMLLDRLAAFQRVATHREPYLLKHDLPDPVARRRLNRNLKRKGADRPEPLIGAVTTFAEALHGLPSGEPAGMDQEEGREQGKEGGRGTVLVPDSAVTALSSFVSFAGLRQAIEQASDTTLLDAYEQVGQALPAGLPTFMPIVNVVALPFLAERLAHDARTKGKKQNANLPESFNLDAILADLRLEDGHVHSSPDNPASWLRLILAALLIQAIRLGDQLFAELGQAMQEVRSILTDFAVQRGYPGAEALRDGKDGKDGEEDS
jgi:hypothetical protein